MRRLAVLPACAAFAAAMPLHAQSFPVPTVRRVPIMAAPRPAAPVAANDDLPLRRRVAGCIAATPTRPLVEWLDTLPGSSQDAPLASHFSLAACMAKQKGGWARFGARDGQFRLLVAEALVSRRVSTLPAASPAQPGAAPWFAAKLARLPAGAPVDRESLALDDFGTCIAQSDWSNAVAMLRAPSNSPGEKAAVARLAPKLAPCTSLQLKMDRPTLRLIVASGIYHLAVAPALTASASRG